MNTYQALKEKAVSKQQQKLFGLALSVKRGDTPRSEVSKQVLKIVDSMPEKEIKKYAGVEHKDLPDKKEYLELGTDETKKKYSSETPGQSVNEVGPYDAAVGAFAVGAAYKAKKAAGGVTKKAAGVVKRTVSPSERLRYQKQKEAERKKKQGERERKAAENKRAAEILKRKREMDRRKRENERKRK